MACGIIVGKDAIDVDDRLLRIMQRHGIDPAQAKNYVTNNRHNHVTAFYYLLKKKVEREPSILEESLPQQPPPPPQQQTQPTQEKRSDSPLIFRP